MSVTFAVSVVFFYSSFLYLFSRSCKLFCGILSNYTASHKKHPWHFRLSLENHLSDFDNILYQYSGHNLPSNDHSVSYLTHCPLLHYL